MIRSRFRVNSVFFENEKTDSLPSQSVFTHHNKKNHFLYRNLSNKKNHFFLQKSKISLQKYQKYVFTHHNKIKKPFFFQKFEIFVQIEEDEVEQLPSRTEAGEDGRTEGEEKTVGTLEQVSLLFFFFLSFFLFIFSYFALSPIENAEKGFGFLFYFILIQIKRRRFG